MVSATPSIATPASGVDAAMDLGVDGVDATVDSAVDAAAVVSSLTTAVSSADVAPPPLHTPRSKLSPAASIKGLYAAFNARDADAAASYLADECVYEDLLLGPSTVCVGKRAFVAALRFHPAFVSSALLQGLPVQLPHLALIVDSVAEGETTVGVEWHVEVGDTPFPLGRGLSQATVDPETGLITRVVDIAEAPWRVVGILLLPLITAVSALSEALAVALARSGRRTR